jgi:hypothetical protein
MKTTLSITSTVSVTEPTTATVVTHHPPGKRRASGVGRPDGRRHGGLWKTLHVAPSRR